MTFRSDVPQGPDWPRWRQLLPHVLATTAHHDDALPANPDARSWLLDRAATYLQVPGQPAEARPLFQRALALTEAAYGPGHPTVATGLNNLASALRELGQPAEARPLYERALALTEAAYGPGHPTVATIQRNLDTLDG